MRDRKFSVKRKLNIKKQQIQYEKEIYPYMYYGWELLKIFLMTLGAGVIMQSVSSY